MRSCSLSFVRLADSPLPSLLDDDPFANLANKPPLDDDPFANLANKPSLSHVIPVIVSPSPQNLARPRSSGHGQARPAHTRPAFAPRPSLPSLHALAQMNVSVPSKKIRKGTPGARLPHEPWDMDLSAGLTRDGPSTTHADPIPSPGTSGTCLASREIAANAPSLVHETSSSRSLSGDDADTDSIPSLSYTTSEPSSSVLSRSSSVAPSDSSVRQQASIDVNSPMDSHDPSSSLHVDHDAPGEDDPLSYHSDFDYYTQSLSDPSDSEHDIDTTSHAKPSPSLNDATPYSSLYDPVVHFDPTPSPDTMRQVAAPRQHPQTDARIMCSPNMGPPHDADGWRGQQVPERHREHDGGRRGPSWSSRDCSGGQSSSAHVGGAGADDNHDDGGRQTRPRSPISTTPDYSSSSDDNADGITVYYSLDGMSNGAPSRPHSKAGAGSDDDVPLAQRVPTALSAQKSIRKQLHDERQQRRLERAKSSRKAAEPPLPFHPAEPRSTPAAPARFRKRSMSAAPAPGSSRSAPIEAFPVEDLTRKLMNLQACSRAPPATVPLPYDSPIPPSVSPWGAGYVGAVSRSSSRGKHMDHTTYLQQRAQRVPEPSSQDRPLRSMRSFHRSDGRPSETQRSPADQTSPPRLGRSVTAAGATRTTRAGRDALPATHEQYPKSSRVSEDGRRPSATVPRSPIDREKDVAPRAVQRQPVPPLPISDSTPPQLTASRGPVVQQRIFIGDMQRFNMVEIAPDTNAGDVIDTVARQGMLDGSGSWMVFELAQDYGMERPIRDYELLADVSASWNKDKLLNAFVIKQTPLAPLLSRSALPTSSPTHRGWVEWESKRGKWSKRWMELREHGLWLSKREMGKDEVFLCSLSNFDAYFVTRRHKSPKAFVFAIKSTDHLSMFENAADYLHVFCCNPSDGERWMQVVLVARSYVLYQERNVLFTKTGESLSHAKPLARSRTRKQSVSRPAQPLVNVPPPFSQAATANIAFEPGSLLAKRKEITQP